MTNGTLSGIEFQLIDDIAGQQEQEPGQDGTYARTYDESHRDTAIENIRTDDKPRNKYYHQDEYDEEVSDEHQSISSEVLEDPETYQRRKLADDRHNEAESKACNQYRNKGVFKY